eukprot:TCONS_00031637-protein
MESKFKWQRCEIKVCHCGSLEEEHTHCPCTSCEGSAVSRSTEYRHWKQSRIVFGSATESDTDTDTEIDEIDNNSSFSSNESYDDEPLSNATEQTEPLTTNNQLVLVGNNIYDVDDGRSSLENGQNSNNTDAHDGVNDVEQLVAHHVGKTMNLAA